MWTSACRRRRRRMCVRARAVRAPCLRCAPRDLVCVSACAGFTYVYFIRIYIILYILRCFFFLWKKFTPLLLLIIIFFFWTHLVRSRAVGTHFNAFFLYTYIPTYVYTLCIYYGTYTHVCIEYIYTSTLAHDRVFCVQQREGGVWDAHARDIPTEGDRRICMSLVLLNGLENYIRIKKKKWGKTTISRKPFLPRFVYIEEKADDVKWRKYRWGGDDVRRGWVHGGRWWRQSLDIMYYTRSEFSPPGSLSSSSSSSVGYALNTKF